MNNATRQPVPNDEAKFFRNTLRDDRLLFWVASLIVLAGLIVRFHSFGGYTHVGFDEHIYQEYVDQLSEGTSYRELIKSYVDIQSQAAIAFLPPTRITFLSAATLLKELTAVSSLEALRWVSVAFGVLNLFVATVFAWRAAGRSMALGVLALMSVAPLEIHLGHRALIDGFFAFWALLSLWTLWETMRQPEKRGWLLAYGFSLTLLVLTKENAAFVFVALAVLLAINRWLEFGEIRFGLLVATFLGPALGVILLVVLAGGAGALWQAYHLNIQRSYVLEYAIKTGDGPWYRYLLDLFALSPLTVLLACGAICQVRRSDKWQLFLLVFFIATYAVMANLRYGMNLRYGAIWDLPLRAFAFSQLVVWVHRFADAKRAWLLPLGLAIVCAVDLRQYFVLFVNGAIYDPVPSELLRAVGILK